MPEPASARLVDGHLAPDEAWTRSAVAEGGMSLAALVAAHGSLQAGEVVTLVAPLATALAGLHARGFELVSVVAETVWLAADGRPVLLPVGRHERAAHGDGGSRADVATLAATALEVLDRSSAGANRLVAALEAAVDGRLDASGLAAAVLRSAPAMAIGATARAPSRSRRRSRAPRPGERRQPLRVAAVVAAVVVLGVVLGGLWSRHDGGEVLAAPPPANRLLFPSASPAATSWRAVMTTLERARAAAFATGDATSLSAVYADGSPTGSADRRLLTLLLRRGQRAAGLHAYVEHVTVVARGDTRVTLLVTDALTAYDVVARDGHLVRHGSGRPSRTWQVTLSRAADGWRIWSVSGAENVDG